MLGRLEKAHVIPKYLGGTKDSSNLILTPIELHAFMHYLVADSPVDIRSKLANFSSVSLIRSRETVEERAETDRLITLHNADVKRRGV